MPRQYKPSVTVICPVCGVSFKALAGDVNHGLSKLCSMECARENHRRKPLTQRFWGKVAIGEGCWLWVGWKSTRGYGKVNLPCGRGKTIYAHRLSYEIHYGQIPEGLLVCHHCDNPQCVRPEHLFLGTNYDNTQDAVSKGRQKCGRL